MPMAKPVSTSPLHCICLIRGGVGACAGGAELQEGVMQHGPSQHARPTHLCCATSSARNRPSSIHRLGLSIRLFPHTCEYLQQQAQRLSWPEGSPDSLKG